MTKISYREIIEDIKTTLAPSGYKYIGTYPEALNRVGNNYPCYAIRFPNELSNSDEYVSVLSTTIDLQIYILTKDNTDRVVKQNEIEENIIDLMLNNPTLGNSCIHNVQFVGIERGDYNEGNSSYNVGYYSNNNIESISFSLWAMRTV